MDLFGDMLFRCFQTEHAQEFNVEQMRPALRNRFSRLPGAGTSGFCRNADRLMNRFFDYPRWLRKRAAGFDLFHLMDHSYAQLAFELPAGRMVVTCHDLDTFRCLLEPGAEPRPRWFRAMAQRTLEGFQRAAHVICPSHATKAAVLRQGWFSPDQVTVIHPGADPTFFSPPDAASIEAVAELTGAEHLPYLLHVGSTISRKRVEVLLQAFAGVVAELPGLRLVRVGGPLTDEQSELARKLGIAGSLVHAPNLTKTQLAAVYQKAALLLQPSGAEGFGLPVIEAMACGCPVVASDIAPLREAGGSAADYCPVGDIDSWCRTVIRLLAERATAPSQWEARKAEARRHASSFTWSENVRQTVLVYRRVVRTMRNK